MTSLARVLPETEGKAELVADARARAAMLADAGSPKPECERAAALELAAAHLGSVAASRRRDVRAVRVLDTLAHLTGLSGPAATLALAALALRDPERLSLPPRAAVRAQLRLLAGLRPLVAASLWSRDRGARLQCVAHAGGRPSRVVRRAAVSALAGKPTDPSPRRTVIARPVNGVAAVAGRTHPGGSALGLALLGEAAAQLALALEREALLDSGDRGIANVTRAGERQLARFGIDLHDGPAQTSAALLADLRLFQGQLERSLGGDPRVPVLSGRVEDLQARALAVQGELRDLARTAHVPPSLREPVADVLRGEVRAFARAAGVTPELHIEGPVDVMTPSQRIALLRGIQEALRNAREHARASAVSIRVVATAGSVRARVRDDGRGFDVDRAIARARTEGRIGLTGIAERARLLGGTCEVRSRPGGPSTVSITLPRWDPRRPETWPIEGRGY